MNRSYQITGIVFILFSAFVVQQSLELEFYTDVGPGAGFFPFWNAVIMGSLGAIMLYRASVGPSDPIPADFYPSKAGYMRIGAIVLALVGTVVLMKPLGFRLTMLVFLALLLIALGRQRLIVTAMVAVAGSFGVYHVFAELLKVPLPMGVFGV